MCSAEEVSRSGTAEVTPSGLKDAWQAKVTSTDLVTCRIDNTSYRCGGENEWLWDRRPGLNFLDVTAHYGHSAVAFFGTSFQVSAEAPRAA